MIEYLSQVRGWIQKRIRKRNWIFSLIEKVFGDILMRYQFEVTFEGKYDDILVFSSDNCKIRFVDDRGFIGISAASTLAPNYNTPKSQASGSLSRWFDFEILIPYLTDGKVEWHSEFCDASKGLTPEEATEKELRRQKKVLDPYWDQIISLFRLDVLKTKLAELEDYEKKWFKELKADGF